MYRIIGNSTERVPLPDLNDVLYYRQVKEITDEEFNNSRDLKRELQRGKICVLEKMTVLRPSAEVVVDVPTKVPIQGISTEDLKRVFREILPELRNNFIDTRVVARELAPIIADMIRQEVTKFGMQSVSNTKMVDKVSTQFVDDIYVPTVSIEGLNSNIEAKITKESSDTIDNALQALKNIGGL